MPLCHKILGILMILRTFFAKYCPQDLRTFSANVLRLKSRLRNLFYLAPFWELPHRWKNQIREGTHRSQCSPPVQRLMTNHYPDPLSTINQLSVQLERCPILFVFDIFVFVFDIFLFVFDIALPKCANVISVITSLCWPPRWVYQQWRPLFGLD